MTSSGKWFKLWKREESQELSPRTSSFRSRDDEEESANKTETEQPEIEEENQTSMCLQSQMKAVFKV